MEKEEFINRLTSDLKFTASISKDLTARPTALREVSRDPRVAKKIVEDPVFFAVLMCNDVWLVNAPDHQKLLRDMSQRHVAVCGRGWESPWSSAVRTFGSFTPSRKSRA